MHFIRRFTTLIKNNIDNEQNQESNHNYFLENQSGIEHIPLDHELLQIVPPHDKIYLP